MRALFVLGVILILLGVVSLFVPIPIRERHGFNAGPVSVGVETTEKRKIDPIVSAVLVGGGVLLTIVGRKGVR
ncbi:MAG: hypothetical protein M3041_04500 [Acidobacteriota bacterium]|nr:hypothetical protein [Acidobacteriota bacterium]